MGRQKTWSLVTGLEERLGRAGGTHPRLDFLSTVFYLFNLRNQTRADKKAWFDRRTGQQAPRRTDEHLAERVKSLTKWYARNVIISRPGQ